MLRHTGVRGATTVFASPDLPRPVIAEDEAVAGVSELEALRGGRGNTITQQQARANYNFTFAKRLELFVQ